MDLELFRIKVQEYRKFTGKTQDALAKELNLHPKVLSQKLNNIRNARLLLTEIKLLITTLARWQAIVARTEVVELLDLLDLKPQIFTEQEWQNSPLVTLEDNPPYPVQTNKASERIPASGISQPAPQPILPAQTTLLIGRETMTGRVCQLIQSKEVRLLTLTGPGGVGKTRLGLEVATRCGSQFQDGIFWVEMATLQEPSLVSRQIASALGLKETKKLEALEQLKAHLRDKSALLLLDNFEQLVQAAPVLSELLAATRSLKLLVTSRTTLRLYGEYEVIVPPLELAGNQGEQDLASLQNIGAIQLFSERARAVDSGFQLTEQNIGQVSQICNYLDGLPLAIELAATWSKFFSPAGLLNRLSSPGTAAAFAGNRLELLTSRAANLPERHQTLRNTLDLSYSLLKPPEQNLFSQLGIFNGSFSLEAIQTICYGQENRPEEEEVLEWLHALANHSLLQYQREGLRFSLLETIREYCLKRLGQAGEIEALYERHFNYYLKLVEQAEPELQKASQDWLIRLRGEDGNLRVCLSWCRSATTRAEGHLRFVSNLWRYWQLTGRFSEGRKYLETALSQAKNTPLVKSLDYARALSGLGVLVFLQGEYEQAQTIDNECLELMQALDYKRGIAVCLNNLAMIAQRRDNTEAYGLYARSLELMRELDDRVGIGVCLNNLGTICKVQGQYTRARALFLESLAIREELGDKQGMGVCFNNLGRLYEIESDYRQAEYFYTKNLALRRELEDKQGQGIGLVNLGIIAHAQHNYQQASTFYQKALNLQKELGDKFNLVLSLNNLGLVTSEQGNYPQAQLFYRESLVLSYELGYKQAMATGLTGMALIAYRQCQFQKSAQLWSVAELLLEGNKYTKNTHLLFAGLYEQIPGWLHQAIGEEEFSYHRSKAQTIPLEHFIEYALALVA